MTDAFATYDEAKIALLQTALARQPNSPSLLYRLAVAYYRAERHDEFVDCFRRAYLLRPIDSGYQAGALSDLAITATEQREFAALLLRNGVRFSMVIRALLEAEARSGNAKVVHELMDFERFFQHTIAEPPDRLSADEFHRMVADEIRSNLTYYDEPDARAIRAGWRRDSIFRAQTPGIKLLREHLRAHLERYIAALPEDDGHPFLAARPARWVIGGWAVVSGAETYHRPHIHPRAWMTGVYYIVQPEISRNSPSHKGWLRVGMPDKPYYVVTGETRMVEPVPGTVVLMPAYFSHSTGPMEIDQERMCVAFELQPEELAEKSGGFQDM